MTSLIVQILPFTHFQDHTWECQGLLQYFCFEIMVLRYTSFQVSPAFCNSFLVIVATNWSMTWLPICTGTLSPYVYDLKQPRITHPHYIKLNLAIVRLASSLSFVWHWQVPPDPLKMQQDPYIHSFSVEGSSTSSLDMNPHHPEGRDLGPSIHQCHNLHPLYHKPSLNCTFPVDALRDQGCDTQILLSVCQYLLESLAPYPLCCAS